VPGQFDYFVVFADMRTGSNFLEANLNDYDGLTCHGEVFNPHFIGHADKTELAGINIAARDQDPLALLERLRAQTDGLAGFRLFSDHDPRILKAVLDDPRAAKIILTRNPLDSYVSLRIARATGQWRLGKSATAKSAKIDFDPAEFEGHLAALGAFQQRLKHAMQTTGQTGFQIAYDDIQNLDVLNGLARWLGVTEQKSQISQKTKVQNPTTLSEKVRNFDVMQRELANLDLFNLHNTPVFEPRRGGGIPRYLGGDRVALLFMPLPGGPSNSVANWLAEAEGGELVGGFNQKTLRQWMRKRPDHRRFSVVRHPLARLHRAFCAHILPVNTTTFLAIREVLRNQFGMVVPDQTPGDDWQSTQHAAAFLAFLMFLKSNLAGQTSARVDASWASQSELLRGLSDFAPPDMILREAELQTGLDRLAADIGIKSPKCDAAQPDTPFALADVYSEDLEQACRAAYPRDYLLFGWKNWQPLP
jgi:LPS sulfotransferase NodH